MAVLVKQLWNTSVPAGIAACYLAIRIYDTVRIETVISRFSRTIVYTKGQITVLLAENIARRTVG